MAVGAATVPTDATKDHLEQNLPPTEIANASALRQINRRSGASGRCAEDMGIETTGG